MQAHTHTHAHAMLTGADAHACHTHVGHSSRPTGPRKNRRQQTSHTQEVYGEGTAVALCWDTTRQAEPPVGFD